jgi:hypothetical protein
MSKSVGLLSLTPFSRANPPTAADFPTSGIFYYSDAPGVPYWWTGTTAIALASAYSAGNGIAISASNVISTAAAVGIAQSFYDSFSGAANPGIAGHTVENGAWVVQYGDTVRTANGKLYPTAATASSARAASPLLAVSAASM